MSNSTKQTIPQYFQSNPLEFGRFKADLATFLNFDESDWMKFSVRFGLQGRISENSRLLKSLRFRDEDYETQVLLLIEWLAVNNIVALRYLALTDSSQCFLHKELLNPWEEPDDIVQKESKKKFLPRKAEAAIDDAFEMHGGYVLNFSDATMERWFDEEFSLDLGQEKYRRLGGSKAKRLREFILMEEPKLVARVLKRLWIYRIEESGCRKQDEAEEENIRNKLFEYIRHLEGDGHISGIDAIEVFQECDTLNELVASIHRDLEAGRIAAGLDRLHTYATKRFSYLLTSRGGSFTRDEPLHSRIGKYVKLLEREANLNEMTKKMLKSNIGIFDQFNDVRNNHSLAHDNDLVREEEAKYMFECISAALIFFKAIDEANFGDAQEIVQRPET